MRKPDEILAEAAERYNPGTGTNGMLLRQDIDEFLALQDVGTGIEELKLAVELWLATAPWLSDDKRTIIVNDLESYSI